MQDFDQIYASTPLTTAAADELACEVARRALGGSMAVDSAHMHLVSLLYRTAMLAQIAHTKADFRGTNRQDAVDLADRLMELMTVKVPELVDLHSVASGSSFCGWVRHFATAAAQSQWRDMQRGARRAQMVPEDVFAELCDSPTSTLPPADAYEADQFDELAAEAEGYLWHLLPLARTQRQSSLLRSLYALPKCTLPEDPAEVEAARAELDNDPRAAYEVVGLLANGRETMSHLTALFESWDRKSVTALSEADEQVSEAIVRAALSAIPPVIGTVITEVNRRLSEETGLSRRATNRVALAYSRTMSTLLGSEHSTMRTKSPEQIRAEHAAYAEQASELLSACGRFSSLAELTTWLEDAFDVADRERAAARFAADREREMAR